MTDQARPGHNGLATEKGLFHRVSCARGEKDKQWCDKAETARREGVPPLRRLRLRLFPSDTALLHRRLASRSRAAGSDAPLLHTLRWR